MEIDKFIKKKEVFEYDENNNVEDFRTNPLITTRSIKEYFEGSNIFVTGATGFLGKVLIEKLLRSCNGINKIYIILRSKRGMCSEQRYEEFKANKIFDQIREKDPNVLSKVVFVAGDISEANIGLSEKDSMMLQETVDIVFHVAATVRFDEPLKIAANLNTFGTQRIMQLCTKMKHLKSLVHVSTAYSNPYLQNVGEQVYGSTADEDHNLCINGVGVLPDNFITAIAEHFQKKHPNTYTQTKEMAERIVLDYHGKLPVCIVRPSIVTAANEEPCPGWIDNIYGITGMLMEISRGAISSARGIPDCKVDLIPVDIVCNTMITAAWANSFNRACNIPVYNCTSGQRNPFTWQGLNDGIVKFARKYPTIHVMMTPGYTYRTNLFIHRIYEIVLHYLPAIAFDLVLRGQGKKPFLYKLAKRFKLAGNVGTYFASNEWNFETGNVQRIIQAARETQVDADEFKCDVTALDWDAYMEKYLIGIRTNILKDDMSTVPKARKKLQRIIWMKRIFQIILLVFVYFTLFHGFWR